MPTSVSHFGHDFQGRQAELLLKKTFRSPATKMQPISAPMLGDAALLRPLYAKYIADCLLSRRYFRCLPHFHYAFYISRKTFLLPSMRAILPPLGLLRACAGRQHELRSLSRCAGQYSIDYRPSSGKARASGLPGFATRRCDEASIPVPAVHTTTPPHAYSAIAATSRDGPLLSLSPAPPRLHTRGHRRRAGPPTPTAALLPHLLAGAARIAATARRRCRVRRWRRRFLSTLGFMAIYFGDMAPRADAIAIFHSPLISRAIVWAASTLLPPQPMLAAAICARRYSCRRQRCCRQRFLARRGASRRRGFSLPTFDFGQTCPGIIHDARAAAAAWPSSHGREISGEIAPTFDDAPPPMRAAASAKTRQACLRHAWFLVDALRLIRRLIFFFIFARNLR